MALILITSIFFIRAAVDSYNYDRDPSNSENVLVPGLGAALIVSYGVFAVFYELDLFYTVYYLSTKPRESKQWILVILPNLTWMLIFIDDAITGLVRSCLPTVYDSGVTYRVVPLALFSVYAVLKIVHLLTRCFAGED